MKSPAAQGRANILCDVIVPVKVENTTNARWHWGKKERYTKGVREAVGACVRCACKKPSKLKDAMPLKVTMTRYYKHEGHRMDGDGLVSSMKAVRDEIAAIVGVDDKSVWYDWQCVQERSETKGVRVIIEGGKGGDDGE